MLLQEPLVETQCHSHQRQIPGRSLASALCLRVSEQPDASLDPALEQWEACLSVGTAFDPLHFIDESFNHAIAPGQTTPVGHSLRIIGQPVDKSDQFRNPSGLDSGFPLL
jgi:hypothetical protein